MAAKKKSQPAKAAKKKSGPAKAMKRDPGRQDEVGRVLNKNERADRLVKQQWAQGSESNIRRVQNAVQVAANVVGTAGAVRGVVSAARGSYALGKTVVHGSPKSGLKTISPRTGSVARPNEKVAFGFNPRGASGTVANDASVYAKGSGSVYVGKVPRGSIVKDPNKGVVVSKAPIKVRKEIRVGDPKFAEKVNKAIPGSRARAVKRAAQAKRAAARDKKANKNSNV